MAKINKIRLSGTTYDIQDSSAITQVKTINGQSLVGSGNINIEGGSGGGGGNNVIEITQAEYDALVDAGTIDSTALYVITDAEGVNMNNYVSKAENEVNGYTQYKTPNTSYSYNDNFTETLIISAPNNGHSSNNVYALGLDVYTSQNASSSFSIRANHDSNGNITAYGTDSPYITQEIKDGKLYITPNDGYRFKNIGPANDFTVNYVVNVEAGQSKDFIENTIIPSMNDLSNEIIGNKFSEIYIDIPNESLYANIGYTLNNGSQPSTRRSTRLFNDTVNYSQTDGIKININTDYESWTVLNTSNYSECQFYLSSYRNTRVTFNPRFSTSTVNYSFRLEVYSSTNGNYVNQFEFVYKGGSITSITSSNYETYFTLTDNISTDNTIEITPKEGYFIRQFRSNDCQFIGTGATDSQKESYLVWLVEGKSYSHPIQEVVDNIYDKLGGIKLQKITQAEYDALETKDENTLYVISE